MSVGLCAHFWYVGLGWTIVILWLNVFCIPVWQELLHVAWAIQAIQSHYFWTDYVINLAGWLNLKSYLKVSLSYWNQLVSYIKRSPFHCNSLADFIRKETFQNSICSCKLSIEFIQWVYKVQKKLSYISFNIGSCIVLFYGMLGWAGPCTLHHLHLHFRDKAITYLD